MSRDELLAILREPRGDREISHGRADDAVAEYIRNTDPELADALVKAADVQGWWYA